MIYPLYTVVRNTDNTLEIEDTIFQSMDFLCTELKLCGMIDDYLILPVDRTTLVDYNFHRCSIESNETRDSIAFYVACNYHWTHYYLVNRVVAAPQFTTGRSVAAYEITKITQTNPINSIVLPNSASNTYAPNIITFKSNSTPFISIPPGHIYEFDAIGPPPTRKSCSCGACKTFGEKCDKQFHSTWCDLSK